MEGAKTHIFFRFKLYDEFLIIGIAGMSVQQEDEILPPPPRSPTAILSDVQLRIVTGGKPAANGIAVRHNPTSNGQNCFVSFVVCMRVHLCGGLSIILGLH